MINKNIFRGYDIRGIYEKDLTFDVAFTIGKSFGTKIKSEGKNFMVIGYDNRESSPILFDGLKKGVNSTGIDVINIGMVTTPMYYFALNKFNAKAGIMITGSHNPKEYNGFKITFNGIHNAYGDDIIAFRDFTLKGEFIDGQGSYKKVNIEDEYVDYLTENLKISKNLKVLVDCGNGASSIIVDKVFSKLGLDYETMYCKPDFNYPNHHPDPSVYENLKDLQKEVINKKFDLGIAFDGDADRIGLVDNEGEIIPTDHYMIIVIRNIIDNLDDKRFLFDVKCSKALEDEIKKLGGTPIMYRTGNSYLRAKTYYDDIKFSGEYSGHIFFNDKFYGFDDGIYCGLRMLEIMSETNLKASQLKEGIEKYYSTEEIKVNIDDNKKFKVIDKVVLYAQSKGYNTLTIDGCKVMDEDSFALIRASNTGPNITMRFEAKTMQKLNKIQKEFETIIKEETN